MSIAKKKTGELEYKGWKVVLTSRDDGGFDLALNGVFAGNFKTSTAAIKWARETAFKKFGQTPPLLDTLVLFSKFREGSVVPLCWSPVPENSPSAGGRGLAECPNCPYRFACAPEDAVVEMAAPVPKQVESDDSLIARLQAKLQGGQ